MKSKISVWLLILLTFHSHMDKIVARAFNLSIYLTQKCFVSRNVATLMRTFMFHVRPMLEYASFVWSPYHDRAN